MEKNIFMPESCRGISIPNWLTRVSFTDSLEGEFESLFYSHAANIFPDYRCLDFKIKIQGEDGATIPDFALIAKDYSNWIIGEVELVSHNLLEHVLPQVDRFLAGNYDEAGIAAKLCAKYPGLDAIKTRRLLSEQAPEVFVIANDLREEWRHPLKYRNVKYISLEVYSSPHKERIIHVCGDNTSARLTKIAEGIPGEKVMGMQTIALDRPIQGAADTIQVVTDGSISEWLYVSTGEDSLLITTKSFKHIKAKYTLFFNHTNNSLTLL